MLSPRGHYCGHRAQRTSRPRDGGPEHRTPATMRPSLRIRPAEDHSCLEHNDDDAAPLQRRRATRSSVKLAVGRRPAADVPRVTWVECATEPAVIARVDKGGLDLILLDGEASPAGGWASAASSRTRSSLPAGDRAHRPPGRSLARHVVACRRGDRVSAGPDPRGGVGRGDDAPPRARRDGPVTIEFSWPALLSALLRGEPLTADQTPGRWRRS